MEASRHTVLVIEAPPLEEFKASGLTSKLREAGYDVLVTKSSYEAIGLVFVNRRIEAVVVVSCGVPMSPGALAAQLRTINPRILVLPIDSKTFAAQSTTDGNASILSLIESLESYWRTRKPAQSTSVRSDSSMPEHTVIAG